jgi:hypothetical protein
MIPTPHKKQLAFLRTQAKRRIIRAGRRSGKTQGFAILNLENFLHGKRELYVSPTSSQLDRWWSVVTTALQEPVKQGIFKQNSVEHFIELPFTNQRIAGRTGWEPDHLRGDYCDTLVLDEFQLMHETIWSDVGAPMLLDRDGTAVFGFTPRSLHNRSTSKAEDPQFCMKLYRQFEAQMKAGNTRFYADTFTSFDNPHISKSALNEIMADMTATSYQLEIMAVDMDEVPGALWTRKNIEDTRLTDYPKEPMQRIVIGVDPAGSLETEIGIVATGRIGKEFYTLKDCSLRGTPEEWANEVVKLYRGLKANLVVAEGNYGGEMVRSVLHNVAPGLPVKLVNASRGKMVRAEPIAAIWEQGRGHMVGYFKHLESELCMYLPGDPSPNRLDAFVWSMTEQAKGGAIVVHSR